MNMSTTLDMNNELEKLNYDKAVYHVKKLQKRIVEAYKKGDIKRMLYCQHVLIHSYYAKALAIHCVRKKSGSKYPGIDGITWSSFQDGMSSIIYLEPRHYKPKPLKRIYFKKSNGQKRPIGIPTLQDRAIQTLYRFALEPISEFTADSNSFAYRKNRNAKDAVIQINRILSENKEFEFVLKMDIHSCFDSISHDWLLDNIPFDRKILLSVLKCGYVDKDVFYMNDKGIPQGGCLSSVLCNMTLDGLEALLAKYFGDDAQMVRYADDIAIFVAPPLRAEDVLPVLSDFLNIRALTLSKEKTQFLRLEQGFDFLGYHIKKADGLITCVPSLSKKEKYLNSINTTLQNNSDTPTIGMYKILSPRIRGWINYYIGVVPPYYLQETEFETMACIIALTGDTSLAAVINRKIFMKYDYFY